MSNPGLLFHPFDKLVTITIGDKEFQVPEGNMLLRAFQYLSPEEVSCGRFCWNEECQYCRVNFDLAIGKTTSLIGERLKMELRAELFNVFNHAEFANPDTNIQDQGSTFGEITQTGDTGSPVDPKARVIQLAVRFTF